MQNPPTASPSKQAARAGGQLEAILSWSAIAVFAGLAIASHLRITAVLVDDAFITYRYSANLLRGWGMVYNPGEHVLGTSTPAYTLLLAGLGAVWGIPAIPVISRLLNLILLGAGAAGFAAVACRLTGRLSLAALMVGFTVLGSSTLFGSVGGMESPLFVALVAAALWTALTQRWGWTAVCCGLSPLVRPEGVFVIGLGVLAYLAALRRGMPGFQPIRGAKLTAACAALIVPSLVWGGFALIYFGSPLPQSVIAKASGLYQVNLLGSTLSYFNELLDDFLAVQIMPDGRTRLMLVPPLIALVMGGAVLITITAGGVRLVHSYPILWPVPALAGILVIFYITSRTLIFPHYLLHSATLARTLFYAGLIAFGERLVRRLPPAREPGRYNEVIGLLAALSALLPSLITYPWHSVLSGQPDIREIGQPLILREAYRPLGAQIGPQLPEGSTVLLPEIGVLGFEMDRVRVLDSAGLVSPEAMRYFAGSDTLPLGGVPPLMVHDEQPDLLITSDRFDTALLADPWFNSRYRLVTACFLPEELGESGRVAVYSRHDFEPGLALQFPDQGTDCADLSSAAPPGRCLCPLP